VSLGRGKEMGGKEKGGVEGRDRDKIIA